MQKESLQALACTMQNAIDNLDWSAVPDNGLSLCCPPLDKLRDEHGLDVTAVAVDNTRFFVVCLDGEPEYVDVEHGGVAVAEAIDAFLS